MSLTGRQLVEKLLALSEADLDLPVYTREGGGCSECNQDGYDYYTALWNSPDVSEKYVNGYRKPIKKVIVL